MCGAINQKFMHPIFSELKNFVLPSWEELPNKKMYGEELSRYVNNLMLPLQNERIHLTTTMIQNYLKWNLLPPVEGRKYDRTHLAWCICITLYKRIIPLKDVATGIMLQQKFMNVADAYNKLSEFINSGFKAMLQSLEENDDVLRLPQLSVNQATMSLALSANTFVLQCFLDCIVAGGGLGLATSDKFVQDDAVITMKTNKYNKESR